VPIFIERFLLPILATLVTGVCLFNPWKWDWHQRISLFLGVAFLVYFFAYTSFRSKSAATALPTIESPQKSGNAITGGDKSPAVSGNGNSITYDDSSHLDKKPEPPKKE